uniref:Uncharacterized protein n=1 Tax=Bicosoecida sp. CB-2014 TaxID=1486930 RepID=A0A7S1G5V8_9STRA
MSAEERAAAAEALAEQMSARLAALEATVGLSNDSGSSEGGAAAGAAAVGGEAAAALLEENAALKERCGKLEYRVNILLRSLEAAEAQLRAARGVRAEDVGVAVDA